MTVSPGISSEIVNLNGPGLTRLARPIDDLAGELSLCWTDEPYGEDDSKYRGQYLSRHDHSEMRTKNPEQNGRFGETSNSYSARKEMKITDRATPVTAIMDNARYN